MVGLLAHREVAWIFANHLQGRRSILEGKKALLGMKGFSAEFPRKSRATTYFSNHRLFHSKVTISFLAIPSFRARFTNLEVRTEDRRWF